MAPNHHLANRSIQRTVLQKPPPSPHSAPPPEYLISPSPIHSKENTHSQPKNKGNFPTQPLQLPSPQELNHHISSSALSSHFSCAGDGV
ncbi:hypothetical protein CDAR_436641 [Caerostris darwini]|uniref:Uncharacterized protein n=1 Tax=Caerostris darwini TaxID=1538125 RepID=A0AAV4SD94_9ARAC|nr:hypothetical protein CDAR_436641 [Caerostris darwini]